jgi:hypothetical protein
MVSGRISLVDIYNESRHDARKIKNLLTIVMRIEVIPMPCPGTLRSLESSPDRGGALMSWKHTLWNDNPHQSATAGAYTTPWDRILLCLVVLSAAGLFLFLPRYVLSGATEIEIQSGDRLVGTYPLHEDRTIEVHGRLGVTVVRIQGGRAHIESSCCRNGICTRLGEIGSEGGALACVPNEVVVQSPKARADGLDAVAR